MFPPLWQKKEGQTGPRRQLTEGMLKHKGSCCDPAKPSPVHLQNLSNLISHEDTSKWEDLTQFILAYTTYG